MEMGRQEVQQEIAVVIQMRQALSTVIAISTLWWYDGGVYKKHFQALFCDSQCFILFWGTTSFLIIGFLAKVHVNIMQSAF